MMSSSDSGPPDATPFQVVNTKLTSWKRQYQQILDRWTPHVLQRWCATAGLLAVFMLRIVLAQGWYIICYALAIYLLNLLLAFLQPRFDPSLQEDLLADEVEGGGETSGTLPSQRDDEFRPFVRRLPEWQFWLSSTRAMLVALLCTTSEAFDVPVYWPILVVYFLTLFALTMRRQIQHMVKYKFTIHVWYTIDIIGHPWTSHKVLQDVLKVSSEDISGAYPYGSITSKSSSQLLATTWRHPSAPGPEQHVVIHHLTLKIALEYPGLVEYLGATFVKEVEDGLTYPQEDMTPELFTAYFFAADVLVAFVVDGAITTDGEETSINIQECVQGRNWGDCVVGYYYVKPNYPGRSSHICNAGFVVPPSHRGSGYGRILAASYLHYGPKLGYRASVFNLVYVNNHASIKLWDKLGFTRAGLIPQAGRLRKRNGEGEEYVDAWVYYKSFV